MSIATTTPQFLNPSPHICETEQWAPQYKTLRNENRHGHANHQTIAKKKRIEVYGGLPRESAKEAHSV